VSRERTKLRLIVSPENSLTAVPVVGSFTAIEDTRESDQRDDRCGLVMESVKDYAIILLDSDGKFVSWNVGAEQLFGYQKSEILGRHISCVFTPKDSASGIPEQKLLQARTEQRAEYDCWLVRKDGSRFWANGIVTMLKGGLVTDYASIIRDFTEQHFAQEFLQNSEEHYRNLSRELAAMNQRKDKFLAMVSHELRNPLAPLSNALQTMQLDSADNPAHRPLLDIMERQVQQLARLIDDLLEAARLTAGKLQIRKELVDIRVAVERAVEASRPFIEEGRHELAVQLPDEPLVLDADPVRLEQILTNVLNNAAKYTKEPGQILVTAERDERNIVLKVKDTGIGIPPDMLARIFEMFAQVDRSTEQSHGGLGIGLALVKRLVDMHDGTIQATSGGTDQGSTFTISLPLSTPPPQSVQSWDDCNASNEDAFRILIIDDDLLLARSLTMMLKAIGNDTRVGHDGPEAIEIAAGFQPGLVLIDIGLPTLNGYDTVRQLKEQPACRNAFFVAMMGSVDETAKHHATEAGFDYFFTKPFNPVELQKLVLELRAKSVNSRAATVRDAASTIEISYDGLRDVTDIDVYEIECLRRHEETIRCAIAKANSFDRVRWIFSRDDRGELFNLVAASEPNDAIAQFTRLDMLLDASHVENVITERLHRQDNVL
jgi:PAS domain S-box-containing protein